MARLILTDCFGVVLDEIAPIWFQEHFRNPQEAKLLKDKYFVPFDLGDVSFDEVMGQMAEELHFEKDELKEYWLEGVVINQELLAFYDHLREQGDIIALASNAGKPFLDDILDQHDLRRHFDAVFISSHFHIVKPNPAFYEKCLSSFSDPFSEIFMIDDSPANLQGLRELGIQPILFQGNEELRKRLG